MRIVRVPILAIVVAGVLAGLGDLGGSYALGRAIDRGAAARVLEWLVDGDGHLRFFRTLGGYPVSVSEEGAVSGEALEIAGNGAARGGLIAITLSLLAMAGRLRVRIGAAR
jgi:hypothetical protein